MSYIMKLIDFDQYIRQNKLSYFKHIIFLKVKFYLFTIFKQFNKFIFLFVGTLKPIYFLSVAVINSSR